MDTFKDKEGARGKVTHFRTLSLPASFQYGAKSDKLLPNKKRKWRKIEIAIMSKTCKMFSRDQKVVMFLLSQFSGFNNYFFTLRCIWKHERASS